MPQRYFTPVEVAAHNVDTDIWVSFLGKVANLTPLIQANKGSELSKPIIAAAGTDISHWFNATTGELRTHCDPVTGLVVPYTPKGRFLHVAPPFPTAEWATNFGTPWWRDEQYVVGRLTSKPRHVRVVNMLSSQEQILQVCSEETITEIEHRYAAWNAHTTSYTWKFNGVVVDMAKTLAENGLPDDAATLHQLAIDEAHEASIPELHVYYNDDLTEN